VELVFSDAIAVLIEVGSAVNLEEMLVAARDTLAGPGSGPGSGRGSDLDIVSCAMALLLGPCLEVELLVLILLPLGTLLMVMHWLDI
jgi:hypothetical protein